MLKGTRHLKRAESGQNITLILSLHTIGVSVETVFTLIICLTTDKHGKFQICTCKIVIVHVYVGSLKYSFLYTNIFMYIVHVSLHVTSKMSV